MESLSYKYHFNYKEVENESYEITIERKQFSVFLLTFLIKKNYPLSEPEVKFNLLSHHHESILQQNTYKRCSSFLPRHWTPSTKLVDIIVDVETAVYKSLIMRNQLYDLSLYSCLITSAIFIIVAYFDKSNGLSKIKDNIDEGQIYPFYIIIKKFERTIATYLAQLSAKKYLQGMGSDVNYELGADHIIFNILYFAALAIFFMVSISEKRFRMNKKYFLIYLFLTLVNPVTIAIIATNHLRNFSYIMLAASVLFLSIREYEISLLSFISSYCLNVDMLRVSFVEFIVLFVLVLTVNAEFTYGIVGRIKKYMYNLWLIGLFVFINWLINVELDLADKSAFMRSIMKNLLENLTYSPFVLLSLSNLLYYIYKQKKFDEKLYVDFIVLAVIVNGFLNNTNHLLVEHTFAIFLLNLKLITQKTNYVTLAVCSSKIVTTILLLEKDYAINIATLVVQAFTISFLIYRNKLFVKNERQYSVTERKLTKYEQICEVCWKSIEYYGKTIAVLVVCINAIGFLIKLDKLGDATLIVYFAILRPMAKIFNMKMRKVKND